LTDTGLPDAAAASLQTGQNMDIPNQALPVKAPGGRFKLLDGIVVVDLTTSLAGPYASMLLSDFGADIIKIERPGTGDDSRHWTPPSYAGQSLWYQSINRNKRSVTLDFSTPAGRELLHELVRKADVLITNQLPKVQRKLGIDWDTIRAIRPDIIYASLTGFGLGGGRSDDPCYDLIAEGYSGIMDLTGELANDPQKVGTPAADLLGGSDLALGVLAALLDRKETGKGHMVEISLVDSMTRFMTPRIVGYLGSGIVPRRSGARDSVIAIYQVFQTADDPLTLGLPNDAIWQRFCVAVERADLAADPALARNDGRVDRRAELVATIQSILLAKPREHWLALFRKEKVPAGPINRVDQVTQDEELLKRGLFYAMQEQGIPQVGLGIRIDGADSGYDRVPPTLGADTDEVLQRMLTLTADQISKFRQEGVL
jgi:crotonobetainyl-CoA:carnitine CoA-transferase CaiB-like acyl-CoA transferase